MRWVISRHLVSSFFFFPFPCSFLFLLIKYSLFLFLHLFPSFPFMGESVFQRPRSQSGMAGGQGPGKPGSRASSRSSIVLVARKLGSWERGCWGGNSAQRPQNEAVDVGYEDLSACLVAKGSKDGKWKEKCPWRRYWQPRQPKVKSEDDVDGGGWLGWEISKMKQTDKVLQ